MATKTGVWDLQEVRDKQLASEWSFSSNADPGQLWALGYNANGQLGQNNTTTHSSPVQIGAGAKWLGATGGTANSVSGAWGAK